MSTSILIADFDHPCQFVPIVKQSSGVFGMKALESFQGGVFG
jgi:hypothetical protein